MLGCFHPCPGCIDNAIHTFAGVQLRDACYELMKAQGYDELTGQEKITPAYNLPCDYVIHTVGPIVSGRLTKMDRGLLKSCYLSCLKLAEENGCKSIAFCCISTGVFSRVSQDIGTREEQLKRLKNKLTNAHAIMIGAGAGLSASAGLTYSGERFEQYFFDFQRRFGIKDENGVFQVPDERIIQMRIPTALIPKCPDDGSDVVMILRSDDSFVENDGWHRASAAYSDNLKKHENDHVLYLELGVGSNTPVII